MPRKFRLVLAIGITLASTYLIWRALDRLPPSSSQPKNYHSTDSKNLLVQASASEILKDIQETPATLTILNLWATWCAPCIEEFPELLEAYYAYQSQGVRLLFLSADHTSAYSRALQFLNDQGVDFKTYIKGDQDLSLIKDLFPKWQGALPATLFYDHSGKLIHSHQGMLNYEQLEIWIENYLAQRTET